MVLSWTTLLAIALVSMVIWRAEVYAHGWEGLRWIEYFHWAVPIGVGMFTLWAIAVQLSLSVLRRLALAVALVIASGLCYRGTKVAFAALYAFQTTLLLYPWQRALVVRSAHVWLLSAPVFFIGAAWAARVRPRWGRLAASYAIYLVSAPAAMGLLWVTKHRGGADLIHTIKSGFVIPFLVVALGILFLPRRPADAKEPNR